VAAVFADFIRIGLPTRSAAETAQRTLELALRHDATYYDAAYVALALEEGIPLLATDGPMTQKFKGVVEFVTLQADFAGERTSR
jgi:predicted nucleic acid-binding protein